MRLTEQVDSGANYHGQRQRERLRRHLEPAAEDRHRRRGVDDASLVTISVTAASVLITATIVVPASTTAEAVQNSLSFTLGTAAAASAALGITVESDPSITQSPGQQDP